jgi:hypothetical protein
MINKVSFKNNKIKCLGCGQILESKHRHDFQQCDCENQTFTDGGTEYFRRGGKNLDLIEDVSELVYEEIKG